MAKMFVEIRVFKPHHDLVLLLGKTLRDHFLRFDYLLRAQKSSSIKIGHKAGFDYCRMLYPLSRRLASRKDKNAILTIIQSMVLP